MFLQKGLFCRAAVWGVWITCSAIEEKAEIHVIFVRFSSSLPQHIFRIEQTQFLFSRAQDLSIFEILGTFISFTALLPSYYFGLQFSSLSSAPWVAKEFSSFPILTTAFLLLEKCILLLHLQPQNVCSHNAFGEVPKFSGRGRGIFQLSNLDPDFSLLPLHLSKV